MSGASTRPPTGRVPGSTPQAFTLGVLLTVLVEKIALASIIENVKSLDVLNRARAHIRRRHLGGRSGSAVIRWN